LNNNSHKPPLFVYTSGHNVFRLYVKNAIIIPIDQGENVFLVLLDTSEAFDTVDLAFPKFELMFRLLA